MRIPTSVIVMSLLTAAPFALAVRDELHRKPVVDEDELSVDARENRRLAEYEAEAAREAAEHARLRAEALHRLDELIGTKPASLGSLFEGVTLGGAVAEDAQARLDRIERENLLRFFIHQPEGVVREVAFHIDDDSDELTPGVSACETFRAKLTTAWGPSTGGTWIDGAGQRATLPSDTCDITFERYLEPMAWLDSLQAALIGKPVPELVKMAGEVEELDESVTWTIPGIGYGSGLTELEAIVESGKVVRIHASFDTDFNSVLALRDGITARTKSQPTREDNTNAWVWKKKPGYRLWQSTESNFVTLTVGKDPYQ